MTGIIDKETSAEAFVSAAVIGPEELRQRVAVLKRFRTLLSQQRDRFRAYLEELDKQKDIIEEGSPEELLAHVELEEKIVADIFSIQKVINPLEDMYHASFSGFAPSRDFGKAVNQHAGDVPDLKSALEDLKKEAVLRSTRNKELLSRRMAELRSEIKTLRSNPYAASAKRSSFSGIAAASLVDIDG
jgi:cell division protein FtsB